MVKGFYINIKLYHNIIYTTSSLLQSQQILFTFLNCSTDIYRNIITIRVRSGFCNLLTGGSNNTGSISLLDQCEQEVIHVGTHRWQCEHV